MKVSLIQMNSVSDKPANIAAATLLIERAVAEERPDWIALPECFDFLGARKAEKLAAAETLGDGGPAYEAMRALAAKHKVFIHAGSMLEKAEGEARIHNTTVVFDRGGGEVARYRKIHMFDIETPDGVAYRESAAFKPGEAVATYECEGTTIGLRDLLRSALPVPVPGAGREGRRDDRAAVGLHHADRQGPLGGALPRPRDRDADLSLRAGAVRHARDRQRDATDLRAFDGDRPLGARHGARIGWRRDRLGANRSIAGRQGSRANAGAGASGGAGMRKIDLAARLPL